MSNPHFHARSSVRQFGCTYEFAEPIHTFFDKTKASYGKMQHRALLHHDFGTFLVKKKFGDTELINKICEQHLFEDTSRHNVVIADYWKDYTGYLGYKEIPIEQLCIRTARKFGGEPEDYKEIHEFMDLPEKMSGLAEANMITHNTFGCYFAEDVFGVSITRKSDGKDIPTRIIAELHCLETFAGDIPSPHEVLHNKLPFKHSWQVRGAQNLSATF